ncbi:hypothetical protein LXA43DRAFT_462680 [Ganoderma leucocontextum]|nr:hypothetical protein LXA43DRAFT_462680 [Ganoderma leucocontextum]
MSNSTTVLADELVQELNALFIPTGYYLDVVSIALTAYEHLLTLDTERRVIWGRKLSFPSILFLFNRYLLWMFCISSFLWGLVEWNSSKVTCYMAGFLNILITTFLVLLIAVFLSVRIHVINGHRWFWTCLVFALSSVSEPYNFATLIFAKFQQFNGMGIPLARGCFIPPSDVFEHPSWNRWSIAVQACGCMSNAIAVLITWYRTKDIIFVGRRSGMRTSLASSMLQSGTVFFLVDLFLNVAQIYLFITRSGSIAALSVTVESILTSRFILSLRTHNNADEAFEMSTLPNPARGSDTRPSVLVFDTMAAPLDLWEEDDEHDSDLD